jgi:hypothetical protein
MQRLTLKRCRFPPLCLLGRSPVRTGPDDSMGLRWRPARGATRRPMPPRWRATARRSEPGAGCAVGARRVRRSRRMPVAASATARFSPLLCGAARGVGLACMRPAQRSDRAGCSRAADPLRPRRILSDAGASRPGRTASSTPKPTALRPRAPDLRDRGETAARHS